MIPTTYSLYTRGSFWKTALFTTVLTLLNFFSHAQTTCLADAGSLNGEICIQNQAVTLKATLRGDTVVPAGYQLLYVLTRGDSLVIDEVSAEATFTIDEMEGLYTIHTLVYDSTTLNLGSVVFGQTTGFDIFEMLIAGGGNICAALDTAGVRFRFGDCDDDGCDADAGSLVAVAGACLEDSTATLTATIEDSAFVPNGYSLLYVLTSGDSLVIEQVNSAPTFTVDTLGTYRIHALVYDSTTLNLDSIVFGETTGGAVNLLLIQGGGDICGALDVTGALFEIEACEEEVCEVATGRITGSAIGCLENGDSITLNATVQTPATLPDGYQVLYVLTSGENLVIEQVSTNSAFVVDSAGTYRIHVLVYDPNTLDLSTVVFGQTTGSDVFGLLIDGGGNICGALDTEGVRFNVINCPDSQDSCVVTSGRLIVLDEDVCLEEGQNQVTIEASVQVAPIVLDSYQLVYVLTSTDSLIILDVNDQPSFTVDSIGRYRIHVLVYDSTTLNLDSIVFGTTTGFDVNGLLIQGGGNICGALDTEGAIFDIEVCDEDEDCNVDAGSVATDDGETTFTICTGDSQADIIELNRLGAVLDGGVYVFVITDTANVVIRIIQDDSENLDGIGTDSTFRIWGYVYKGDSLGLTAGDTLSLTAPTDSCSDISTNFITIINDCTGVEPICEVATGRITGSAIGCLENGDSITLSAIVQTEATIPNGYQARYVLTSGENLVIEQVSTNSAFVVDSAGTYRIHVLVYDPNTLDLSTVVFGQTTGSDVFGLLIDGGGNICGALDTEGVRFNVINCPDSQDSCVVTSGRLIVLDEDVCLEEDQNQVTIEASVQVAPIVLDSYQLVYVLTSTDSLVILDVNDQPNFTVDSIGRYRIHVLVYDSTTLNLDSIVFGTTTGFDVNGLLIQGGGNICGALDTEGAIFDIEECPDTCDATFGELEVDPDAEEACLSDSTATLTARVETQPNVPAGYQVIYVLTSGTNLVIEDVNTQPTFTVDTTGRYTIHTLVYDSTTLDLGIIVFGQTTGGEVNELLIQGGGDICAALDVNGLVFNVETCGSDTTCEATFGRLMIIGNDVRCYEGDSITTELRFTSSANVPSGYEVAIIITQGDSMTVTQINDGLSFSVDSTDLYRIHVLVYDPETFNLDDVNIGTTTAADINALLIQGGGSICAALDTNGIVLDIIECDDDIDCEEDVATGSLFSAADGACLNDDFEATLTAQIEEEATLPAGYEVIYVLTSGNNLVIEAVNDEPAFTVNRVGRFRIHVLVYNPATLDLGAINLGTTTASEVNALLQQGGGDICAALDLTGVILDTRDCACAANAGELSYTRAGGRFVCLSGSGLAFLAGNTRVRAIVPLGYRRVYVLTSGNNMVIERVADIPVFGVRATGTYRIHTLVYDPNTINLSNIQLGVTTAMEINELLRQGGGDLCAALELPGLEFTVGNCVTSDNPDAFTIYPNPATNQVNINLPQVDAVQRITVELIDVNGNLTKRWQMDGYSTNANLDISSIQPGMYYVRVLYDQEFVQDMNIVKVR